MWEILGGMVGAVLGVALYRLGQYTARRGTKTVKAAAVPTEASGVTSMTSQEWYNFLNYDGGEQQK